MSRLIRAADNLLELLGTRSERGERITAEWGDPIGHCPDSDEDIYEPILTTHADDNLITAERARIARLIDDLDVLHANEWSPAKGRDVPVQAVNRLAVLALLDAPETEP